MVETRRSRRAKSFDGTTSKMAPPDPPDRRRRTTPRKKASRASDSARKSKKKLAFDPEPELPEGTVESSANSQEATGIEEADNAQKSSSDLAIKAERKAVLDEEDSEDSTEKEAKDEILGTEGQQDAAMNIKEESDGSDHESVPEKNNNVVNENADQTDNEEEEGAGL